MSTSPSPFLNSIARFMKVRGYSKRTIHTYLYWIKYFIVYHGKRHPTELDDIEVEQFLTFLSADRNVSVATQRLVLNSLAFLYNRFLEKPLGDVSQFRRSKKQAKLPVVLTGIEVQSLLACLSGTQLLIVPVLYGSGLRRIEAVRLRVKDIEFDYLQIRVWNGKGFKHRITTLAPELVPFLKNQISKVNFYLSQDVQNEQFAGAWMRGALARKYPNAGKSLAWQYLFPA